MRRLSSENIAEAAGRIDPAFRDTPKLDCEPLSDALGCRLTLSVETVNPIRSFKGRGADYFMTKAVEGRDRRPVVCASAGNFGQAMAYAGRKHGIPVTVFAARSANRLKLSRMRALGATVILDGDDFDAAKDAARAHGGKFVEDGATSRSRGGRDHRRRVAPAPRKLRCRRGPARNGALLAGWRTLLKRRRGRRGDPACARRGPRRWRRRGTATGHRGGGDHRGWDRGSRPVAEALADMHGLVDESCSRGGRVRRRDGPGTAPRGAGERAGRGRRYRRDAGPRDRFAGSASPACCAEATSRARRGKMIDHIEVMVGDLDRAAAFYREALAPLGYVHRVSGPPHGFGSAPDKLDFWVRAGGPAEPRPHYAFQCADRATVEAAYRAGLAAGGTTRRAVACTRSTTYFAGSSSIRRHNVEFVATRRSSGESQVVAVEVRQAAKRARPFEQLDGDDLSAVDPLQARELHLILLVEDVEAGEAASTLPRRVSAGRGNPRPPGWP